jgi:hypothetical protein
VTVAAVVLAASTESALADAAGVARVRRIADAAWSGGALPIVVVAPDPEGAVAAALAGASVTLAGPAAHDLGPVSQIVHGIEVAAGEISGTTAALIWPARLCWVGPETVTSLVEAHGRTPDALLRPIWRGEAGWPAVLPLAALAAFRVLSPTLMPDDLLAAIVAGGLALRTVELGDPGTVMDGSTPRDALPPYEGPAEPSGSMDWGAAVAATSDDAPITGPSLEPSEA